LKLLVEVILNLLAFNYKTFFSRYFLPSLAPGVAKSQNDHARHGSAADPIRAIIGLLRSGERTSPSPSQADFMKRIHCPIVRLKMAVGLTH
jgi:hypothetical protein